MAPAIKHPANFVSTMYQTRGPIVSDVVINPANESASTVNRVRAMIDSATAAFGVRNYPLAIESYKTAQGLCYRLLNPGYGVGHYVVDDRLMHPVATEIEQGLATAGLKLIASMQPDVTPVIPAIAVGGIAPTRDDERLAGLGFQLAAAGAPDKVVLGTTLLVKGRATEAADVLADAVAVMKGEPNTDPGLFATALLNLSSAHLASGRSGDRGTNVVSSRPGHHRPSPEHGPAHERETALTVGR